MKLITLYLPPAYIKAIDELVTEGFFPNRSEALRTGIKQLIQDFESCRRIKSEAGK